MGEAKRREHRHKKAGVAQERPQCIFCAGQPITGEHLWPQWMHTLFLPELVQSRKSSATSAIDNVVLSHRMKETPGAKAWDATVRVVCAPCNGGWMSQLENNSRAVVEAAFKGQNIRLDRRAQTGLASWIALKVLVIDAQEKRTCVSTVEDRKKFFNEKIIPAGMEIFLLRNGEKKFQSEIRKASLQCFERVEDARFDPDLKRNLRSVLFTAGELVSFTLFRKADWIRVREPRALLRSRRLYPFTEEFDWPLSEPASEHDLFDLMTTLDRHRTWTNRRAELLTGRIHRFHPEHQ